jgi:sulfonate transport system substrate-binding protein
MKTFNVGGVPEHFNFPWHIAMEEGLFEKENVSVNWADYPGGTGAMNKDLREGTLDVAVLLTEGAIADITKGNPSVIVSFYVKSPLIWGMHVGANSSYKDVKQLQGQTYAISRPGSGSHLMAYVDAKSRGWDTADLKFETINNLDGARKALTEGEADIFLWEKFTTKPYVDNGEFRILGECPTPWPCFVIVVRKEILSECLTEVKSMLNVLFQCCANLMKDPLAVEKISSRYNIKKEDIALWFAQTSWATDSRVEDKAIEKVMDSLCQLNLIDKVLPVAKVKVGLD